LVYGLEGLPAFNIIAKPAAIQDRLSLKNGKNLKDKNFYNYQISMSRDGIVLLDKPSGPTSRAVVEYVKKLFGTTRAGHVGTLDPRASGVLPILLGNACKLVPVLQGLNKEYIALARLHSDVDQKNLEQAMKNFIGKITQIPPVRSAVARKPREREIYDMKILEKSGRNLKLYVHCSAGTYIRKLVHDIGNQIGGAHLVQLRRISVGPFRDCVPLSQLQEKNILPIESAVQHLKKIFVKHSAIKSITNGSPLFTAGISGVQSQICPTERVAIFYEKKLLALGIAKMSSEQMKRTRGIAAKIDRVLI
jgi:H/ACA ribonucleoprotein complex subunit 4